MKENNVWLSPRELQQMLQGSLQWNDVAPRVSSSISGLRKLGKPIPEKRSAPIHSDQIRQNQSLEQEVQSKRLEGKPVIWLLGSCGLLTLSSWFYFVLFSK